jgi:hypothetical protein
MPEAADPVQQIAELRVLLAAREAELAVARAELTGARLRIEQYKAQLAQLRRMQFGRSSEKLDTQIQQLELMLEDLEEGEAVRPAPAPPHAPISRAATGASRCGGRCPIICRARRSCMIRARSARAAAAPALPSSVRT